MAAVQNTKTTTAAKKAAPKPAAKKAAPAKATLGKKIRWVVGQVHPNGKDQAGNGVSGTQYAITRTKDGAQFVAVVKTPTAQKPVELVTGSFSAAYWAAVNHNKAAVEKADAAAAKKAAPKPAETQVA